MRVLVAAHDAGGAEVVSSWLRRGGVLRECSCVAEGPAETVFRRKLPDLDYISRDDALRRLPEHDLVLTGTSGLADLERVVIRAAREAGVRSATFLDHWHSYETRFRCGDSLVLPDEIWVGDDAAMKLAREQFPATTLKYEPDPHMAEVVEQ